MAGIDGIPVVADTWGSRRQEMTGIWVTTDIEATSDDIPRSLGGYLESRVHRAGPRCIVIVR